MKKRKSPSTPFRVKAKGKETRPGCFSIPLRPQARAHAHEVKVRGEGEQRKISRYRLAGAAADELIDILGGNRKSDHGTWAYYCYHHDIETILEKAREMKSRFRQGELKNPVTAFQRWLQRSYKEGL